MGNTHLRSYECDHHWRIEELAPVHRHCGSEEVGVDCLPQRGAVQERNCLNQDSLQTLDFQHSDERYASDAGY